MNGNDSDLENDIHQANVGFKGNRMVLVDYAGWNW